MRQLLAKNSVFLTVMIASAVAFSFPVDSCAGPAVASGRASATIVAYVENFQIDELLDFGAVQLLEDDEDDGHGDGDSSSVKPKKSPGVERENSSSVKPKKSPGVERESSSSSAEQDGSSGGGTVTVTPANERIVTGHLMVEGHFSHGKISVRAPPGTHYQITHLKAIPRTGGVHRPEVINLHTSSENNPGGGSLQGVTGPAGGDNLFIGGTLVLPPNAQNGRYRTQLELTLVFF